MSAVTILQMATRVDSLLVERLGAKGDDFHARLNHCGYRLPYKIRKAAASLAEAGLMCAHPRLYAQLDEAEVAHNYDLCLRHFGRRRGLLQRLAAKIVMPLLISAALAAAVVYWRGLL